MTSGTLYETGQVILDGSGNGTVRVGPLSAREVWNAANASVKVATNALEARCSIYVGNAATSQYFRDTTLTGSTGDSTGKVDSAPIKVGSYIWAVWTGGDPGQQATLTVTGTKEV